MNPTTDEIRDSIPERNRQPRGCDVYNQFLASKADELAEQIEAETSENKRKDRDELEELYERQRRRRDALKFKHKLLTANMVESAQAEWAERRAASQPTPDEKARIKAQEKEARRRADAPAKIRQQFMLMAETTEGMIDELETRIAGNSIHRNREAKDGIHAMRKAIIELGGTPRGAGSPATSPVVAMGAGSNLSESEMDSLLDAPPAQREATGDD